MKAWYAVTHQCSAKSRSAQLKGNTVRNFKLQIKETREERQYIINIQQAQHCTFSGVGNVVMRGTPPALRIAAENFPP